MIAEKIRMRLSETPVAFDGEMIAMTASFGVVSVETSSGGELILEDLLRHADAALYRAKEGGRNRVECHTET